MDIIIGAGITGLAYANFTKNDYLIIESDQEVGGYCKTIKQDGFTWDYSGHFFHFQNKWMEEYIVKNMVSNDIVRCNKHTQILYGKQYIDFPFQKNIHQLHKEEFIDCLYDLFAPKEERFVSFKEMLYAKFGQSISEKFLIPYNEKLYACDLNNLDKDAMGRFFPYANKEEIVLNFRRNANNSYNAQFTYSKGGAIEYVNSLMTNIDKHKIALKEQVIAINIQEKTVTTDKRELKYDNLISTIPFPTLLRLCGIKFDEQIYSWNKVLVFNLGFNKKGRDRINNWVYFPNRNLSFYRVGYYDNILSEQRMSLYVELSFSKDEKIDVDHCLSKVLLDLKEAGITTDEELISHHHVVMNPAYVHIKKESIDDVATRKELLEKNDIFSIGRYGSWTYSSIEDNMLEAINTAHKTA